MKIFELLLKITTSLLYGMAFLLGAGLCLSPVAIAIWFVLKYGLN